MIRSRLLAAGALLLAVGAAQAQTPAPTAPTTTVPAAPMARNPMQAVGPLSPTAPALAPPTTASPTPGADATTPASTSGAFTPITAGSDLAGTLKASGQFSTLLKVADATGLTPVLARPGLTIFAPTDAAFAASGADVSEAGLKDTANLTKLQGVLTYHVVNAKIPDFKGRQASVTTASATQAKVYLDGTGDTVKVNDASALQPAVSVAGSTIYPIDKVIAPGFTPPTPPPAEAAPAAEEKATATTTTTKKTTTTRKKR